MNKHINMLRVHSQHYSNQVQKFRACPQVTKYLTEIESTRRHTRDLNTGGIYYRTHNEYQNTSVGTLGVTRPSAPRRAGTLKTKNHSG